MLMERDADEQTRGDIEKRIIFHASRIGVGPEQECFDEKAVTDFFAAWRDLVEYYKAHNDMMMNIEILLEHREWMNIFGGMGYNQELSTDCHERAEEAYNELNAYMDDIILAVVRRLYPQGR